MPGCAVEAEQRDQPGGLGDHRRHAMQRAGAAEQRQRPRRERRHPHLVARALEHAPDAIGAGVVVVADHLHVLELATLRRLLQQQRDHELVVVEVPALLAARHHRRDHERDQRIVAAVDAPSQHRRQELGEAVPLVQRPDRRIRLDQVVGDRAHRVAVGGPHRVVGVQRRVDLGLVHGHDRPLLAEGALHPRLELCHRLRHRVRPQEPRQQAEAGRVPAASGSRRSAPAPARRRGRRSGSARGREAAWPARGHATCPGRVPRPCGRRSWSGPAPSARCRSRGRAVRAAASRRPSS